MKKITKTLVCVTIAYTCGTSGVSASEMVGTVGAPDAYGWSENVGWIDFGSTAGGVTVTDSGLSGYAYGENVGWISLSCSNTSSCDAVDFGVATDWRPLSARQQAVAARPLPSSSTRKNYFSSAAVPVTQPQKPAIQGVADEGSLVSQLVALFTRLYPELALSLSAALSDRASAPLAAPSNGLSSCPDMQIGATGGCVRLLQAFLNVQGFTVSVNGAGSPGLETETFGIATRAALAAFQSANSIEPSAGYFGPKTRSIVKALGE